MTSGAAPATPPPAPVGRFAGHPAGHLPGHLAGHLAGHRQHVLLDHVRRTGAARVSELTRLLGVSDMTVRRDVEALAGRGLVERVHGGVLALGARSAEEPGFATKSALQTAQKAAIARAAADLVTPGASVAISAGTTTHALAREIAARPELVDLTVVTNSVPVAQVLHDAAGADPARRLVVISTGGVRTRSDALVGPVAVAALRSLHVDQLFLGTHGLDPVAGVTGPNLDEAETCRTMVAAAARVVLVTDATKWGVVALARAAGLEDVDTAVVDDGLTADALAELREGVGDVVVAP